jgi:hypothetical protein
MNAEFFESIGHIRSEALGMVKNLQAVRGEGYGRVVHSIILMRQISEITGIFAECAQEIPEDARELLGSSQINMVSQIAQYLVRSTDMTEQDLRDAFADAERIQKTMSQLVESASRLSEAGKVVGE